MASKAYNKGIFKIHDSTINLASDTIVCLLLNDSYVHDPAHDFISDVSANEIGVSGYSRQTLSNKTLTEDDTNDRAVFDNTADITFSSLASGETIGWAVIARNTGNDATSELICALDVTDTPTNGGDIVIAFHADGVFYHQI